MTIDSTSLAWMQPHHVFYFIFSLSRPALKPVKGWVYWPCQSTAVQRMSRFDWFMPWHKSAWESSWEIQIAGKAPRLQMDDVEGSWIQYLVWIALAQDSTGKVFGDYFLHKIVLSKGVEGETLVWSLACCQRHTVLAVWWFEASWLCFNSEWRKSFGSCEDTFTHK